MPYHGKRLSRSEDASHATRSMWTLGLSYAVSTFARCLPISIIPTIALGRLGDPGLVSALYMGTSCLSLAAGIALPRLLPRIGLAGTLIACALLGISCWLTFLIPGLVSLFAGLTLYVLMVLFFENASNMAVLGLIPRRDHKAYESRRVMLAAPSYMLGPVIGTAMQDHGLVALVFASMAACTCLAPVLVAISAGTTERLARMRHPSHKGFALRNFLASARLRAAWILAIGRAMWWQMLFVYTPLLAVSLGVDLVQAGILISLSSGLLLGAPLWEGLTRKLGLRRFMALAYTICGLFACVAGFLAQHSFGLFAVAMFASAVSVSAIDSVANTPVLRAVRARDAARMIPVYNTFREAAQVFPAGAYAVMLIFFDLQYIFVATGLGLVGIAWFCRLLPRRA